MTDDRDPFEAQRRQEDEERLWEEHKQSLKILGELLKEERVISKEFDHIFKEFK